MRRLSAPTKDAGRQARMAWGMVLVLTLLASGPSVLRLAANALAAEEALSPDAAASAARKIEHVREGSLAHNPTPVELSESEANSYLQYELGSQYPPGLEGVQLRFTPGRLAGTAKVDFDKAKAASRRQGNPMMDYLLWGQHTLAVEGGFSAVDGVGHFDLEKVALDGVTLPQPMVDYLIERFLRERYPLLALDRPFPLPYSIDRVQVGRGNVVLAGPPADSI